MSAAVSTRVGRDRVVQVAVAAAVAVDLRLRHRVAAAVGPRLGRSAACRRCSRRRVGTLVAAVQFGSLTVIPLSVTLPVLVTVERVRHHLPRRRHQVVVDDFTTWSAGFWVIGMECASVSGPVSIESAVTVLSRSPSPPSCVDLRLRHRVAAGVGPRLGGLQLAVGVRVTATHTPAPRRSSGHSP